MEKTFVIATNNPKKLREMSAILHTVGAQAITMEQAGISTDPEETGKTFEENALIKARAAMQASNMPAIADDSGLVVDALGGAPGIYSARYCPGSDRDKIDFLLRNMEGKKERSARFVSAVACVFPDGDTIVVRGTCEGEILLSAQGEGGFGYDPVFYVPQYGKTFAQLDADVKNSISHRAMSLKKLAEELKKR